LTIGVPAVTSDAESKIAPLPLNPYRQRLDEVVAALDSDAVRGLSDGEACALLERYVLKYLGGM
jgi:hypothetical protein